MKTKIKIPAIPADVLEIITFGLIVLIVALGIVLLFTPAIPR